MKLGKVALEKLKEPENSIETWRLRVKNDPDAVRKLLREPLPVAAVWPISARQALEEFDKKQRVTRKSQQQKSIEKREQQIVEDSSIAKRTLNWTAIAVLVGCVGAFLAYKALAR